MTPALIVQSLSKRFRRYHAHRPYTLQDALQRGLKRLKPSEYFWSLQNVSFEVQPGRAVAVVGPNGAGKSTLLRLIGGIGRPDGGSITVHGRLGALELSTGFHPELTGRENVFVAAIIGGLTRQQVLRKFDSIVDFSGLSKFMDYPLHTYSSGMQMRLAFAVAVHVDPDILLIDEVLTVGDASFQRKCSERILEFKARGCSILLVTHDLDTLETFCDHALYLRGGQLISQGPPNEVIERYLAGDNGGVLQFSDEMQSVTSTL
jgi:lipopolysaccharide transport system ATP-binding protein